MNYKIVAVLFLPFLLLFGHLSEKTGVNLKQLEDHLFLLVNHERNLRGLPALQFNSRLYAMARAHSKKMIEENRLAHDFPGYPKLSVRALQAGLHFSSVGENLAIGDTTVMKYFHEQMLASPGHSQNTLDKDYTHMAIAILKRGNQYYITQDFANIYEP
ncbi:MAG: CAP domain-containing protein [Candidatus Aminicenantes bacterium]|nr:CAP domain-containing protein [Candidatus Aminicenantes bacterium]